MNQPDRLPPHDLGAEQAVVGSLLIGGGDSEKAFSLVKASDFYGSVFGRIYDVLQELHTRSQAIDIATTSHELERKGMLDSIGGLAALNNLMMAVPTSVHLEHYARIVHNMAVLRRLIGVGGAIADIGFSADTEASDAISLAENILGKVASGYQTNEFVHIKDAIDKDLGVLENRDPTASSALIQTGLSNLDSHLGGGLHKSDMIVIAARPSVGKSMLALNIALNSAMSNATGDNAQVNIRNRVAIFSLEMSVEQIATRLLAAQSGIDQSKIRDFIAQVPGHTFTDNEEARFYDVVGFLGDLDIYIDDTAFQTVSEMRGKARRLAAEKGLDLVIVDYMQLIDGGSNRLEINRAQLVSEISRQMKAMAKDLNIPVLALSQLNRAIEARSNRRPLLSDLRESGSIEQDADIVIFIHREDKTWTEEEWIKSHPKQNDVYPKGRATLIIAKHRHGPIGEIHLAVRDEIGRFSYREFAPPNAASGAPEAMSAAISTGR